jgi:hypothetical protein
LLEQNQRIEPSFLINIIPVPAGKSLPQNEHFLGLGIIGVSSRLSVNFLSFSFSLSEHKDILRPDGSLHVPCDDSTLVFSFENADSDLAYFACYARASDDLDDFGWYEFCLCTLSGFFTHH